MSAGKFHFTADIAEAIKASDVIFVAVRTPSDAEGHADLTYVRQAVPDIAKSLNGAERRS